MRIARHIERLEGYTPGEQPKSRRVVKLNTNENPYPPSPRCADVLRAFDPENLRRYPDPRCGALAAALARRCGVGPERVFVGNGSDEILSLCAKAFVEDGEAIGSLDPSYSLYKTLAAIRGVEWKGGAVAAGRPASTEWNVPGRLAYSPAPVSLFLWTNPNAPTGEFAEPVDIAAFAKDFPGVVVVDEAYADFARGNCLALAAAADNANIIVMRTFSKSYSLAGMRVGWCVGPRDLINALYKIKDSYNVDAVAQAVALAALKDEEYHRETVAKVVAAREELACGLRSRGWDAPASESNFIFARPPAPAKAAEVFAALKERGVFVRYFPGPKTGDRLRITVGTPEQNAAFLAAADAACGGA